MAAKAYQQISNGSPTYLVQKSEEELLSKIKDLFDNQRTFKSEDGLVYVSSDVESDHDMDDAALTAPLASSIDRSNYEQRRIKHAARETDRVAAARTSHGQQLFANEEAVNKLILALKASREPPSPDHTRPAEVITNRHPGGGDGGAVEEHVPPLLPGEEVAGSYAEKMGKVWRNHNSKLTSEEGHELLVRRPPMSTFKIHRETTINCHVPITNKTDALVPCRSP